jgi:hypothetical protein
MKALEKNPLIGHFYQLCVPIGLTFDPATPPTTNFIFFSYDPSFSRGN